MHNAGCGLAAGPAGPAEAGLAGTGERCPASREAEAERAVEIVDEASGRCAEQRRPTARARSERDELRRLLGKLEPRAFAPGSLALRGCPTSRIRTMSH